MPDENEAAMQDISDAIYDAHCRSELRYARWSHDTKKAMSELAALFPTMRGVPGTNPWDVETLLSWMNSGAPTSGSWHSAMFLLSVWNPSTNWGKEGLRLRKGAIGKFQLTVAMGSWDHQHIDAMMEWIKIPFWP